MNAPNEEIFESLTTFYTKKVGFELYKEFPLAEGGKKRWFRFADRPLSVMVEVNVGKPKKTEDESLGDAYWKIGLALHDVDLARQKFETSGVSVEPAGQFKDVGYLCHLRDPSNCSIELLQHTFENKEKTKAAPNTESRPLGQDVGVGQITLRVADIDVARRFYSETLGMKFVNLQNVYLGETREFNLYFYGYTEDEPPIKDLAAVGNREWLYQRPYTTIELQHWVKPEGKKYQRKQNFNGVGIFTTKEGIATLEKKTQLKAMHEAEYNRTVLRIPGHDDVEFIVMESD